MIDFENISETILLGFELYAKDRGITVDEYRNTVGSRYCLIDKDGFVAAWDGKCGVDYLLFDKKDDIYEDANFLEGDTIVTEEEAILVLDDMLKNNK